MKILDAIKNHEPKIKGNFHVVVNNMLEFEGYFTQSGKSIYAHFSDMGLVAGSQTNNIEEAKMKALIRLVDLIELKLALHKKEKNYDNLFVKKIATDNINKFIKYAEECIFLNELFSDNENIPLYSEKFEKIDGEYVYSTKKIQKTVNDLKEIQLKELNMIYDGYQLKKVNLHKNKDYITTEEYELIPATSLC